MTLEPKSICIDFDQTLCDSVYPALGPPKPGAKEALSAFRAMGFRIIISSCRSSGWNWENYYGATPFIPAPDRPVFQDMKRWLDEHGMVYDILDDGTQGKVSAAHYIDDKAISFRDNWAEITAVVALHEGRKAHQLEQANKQAETPHP